MGDAATLVGEQGAAVVGGSGGLLLSSDDTGPPPPLAVKVISKANLSQKMIDMHRTSISDVRRLVKRLRAECRVLAELTHPRMIQLVELCESPQNLFIVSERAFGGALLDRIVQAHEANGLMRTTRGMSCASWWMYYALCTLTA